MPQISESLILNALSAIQDPDLKRDIVSLGFIQNLEIKGGDVAFDLVLTTPACPVRDQLVEDSRQAAMGVPGVTSVNVQMRAEVRHAKEMSPNLPPGIKNIVAVASGKGGVGKSTVAANIAVALAKQGARVGMLDADFYGPNQPQMLGVDRAVLIPDAENRIDPPSNWGVKLMSLAFFAPGDAPVMWRGPMLHGALTQFLNDVKWGEIDYLVVDMPPGTGDVQITLAQNIPLTGVVIVTTPQSIALSDVRRSMKMFEKTNTPILGVIENMAGFLCPHCEKSTDVFSKGGGAQIAKDYDAELLGRIPLDPTICELGETGKPIAAFKPEHPISKTYLAAAQRIAAKISIAAARDTQAPIIIK